MKRNIHNIENINENSPPHTGKTQTSPIKRGNKTILKHYQIKCEYIKLHVFINNRKAGYE